MTTLTEGKHSSEFIVSEANGDRSRATGTVTAAQNLVAGQVVQFTGGKLVAQSGAVDTAGALVTAPAGILLENRNASTTGPYGATDWTGCVYIARDAEVQLSALTFPTETTVGEQALVVAALATLGIICR